MQNDLAATVAELRAENERLKLEVESAKCALGWHPDSEQSIADEISELRSIARRAPESVSSLQEQLDAARADSVSAFYLVALVREALGDDGKRMQDEFVEFCKALKAERDALRTQLAEARAAIEVLRDACQAVVDYVGGSCAFPDAVGQCRDALAAKMRKDGV